MLLMYILASDLYKQKNDKYVFKVRNSCCDDYSYLYIKNLLNLRSKLVCRYTITI